LLIFAIGIGAGIVAKTRPRFIWQQAAALIFLFFALIAANYSYSPVLAWNKFWVLAAAVLVFVWVTARKGDAVPVVLVVAVLFVWLKVIDFLLLAYASSAPTFGVLQNYIDARQASMPLADIDDRLGGMLALSIPLALALLGYAWEQKQTI
jgi:hypothetical protein